MLCLLLYILCVVFIFIFWGESMFGGCVIVLLLIVDIGGVFICCLG